MIPRVRNRLHWTGLAVGVWGALPHFVTPRLETQSSVEIVDHVVPGLVVIGICVGALMARRTSDERQEISGFFSGLVLALAGLWMVATHVPLVVQASHGQAPWPGTVYHSAAALAVMVFSLVWMAAYWSPAIFQESAPVSDPGSTTDVQSESRTPDS